MMRVIAGDPDVQLGLRYPDRAAGEQAPQPACLDLERLLVSRLLVQANSGGGKSWLLRRLLEKTFNLVPQVVLDVDDEFHTLREKFPYVLAGAAGGDCRADVRTAQLLARRVLEHGFSLIVGIYELKKHERMRFVRLFLEALIEAPRALWRPLLVVVDEAHLFCPENEKAESAAAVTDLMTRGRKRGFCGVLATQRISKLNKDAAAEAQNKLVGGCTLDVDRKRASDELGFTTREQQLSLRALDPGEFYAFGPALTREVTCMKVGAVQTTHPEPGSRRQLAPPPPPERLKAILSKLADLPKDAEAEEGELQRLRREVAELRRARPQPAAAVVDQASIEAARRQGFQAALGQVLPISDRLVTLGSAVQETCDAFRQDLQRLINKAPLPATLPAAPKPPTAAPAPRAAVRPGADTPAVAGPQQRVLDAMAELEALGVGQPERIQVAFLAGYTNLSSKGFANAMGASSSAGLIEYPASGRIALTDAGRAIARSPGRPRTPGELHGRVLGLLGGVHAKVLEPLIEAYPGDLDREALAGRAGYTNLSSKGFANAMGRLRSLGFLDYPRPGKVRATPVLFLEGR